MFRILALFAAGAAVCAAQDRPSLVNGDTLGCFRTLEGPVTASVVEVGGQAFDRALHIQTRPNQAANPWDIRVRCFQTLPARAGDTILARFWLRTLSASTGEGYARFVVEKGADPWTKSAETIASAGAAWKLVEIPFSMRETYTSASGGGSYNISFWVAFPEQTIEIGGLTIVNYGQNYSYSALGLTAWPYEGREANAPWRAEAARRIDKYRKTDIIAVARDSEGNPIAGAPVHVKMKRHAFGFGTAVDGGELQRNSMYREMFLKYFNKAVLENDLKWPFFEAGWGRSGADFALPWLAQNGISEVRGHNIIWPGMSNLPDDVQTLIQKGDRDALRKRIDDHIAEITAYTRGKVTEWDVVNEPYSNKDVQKLLGDAEMASWFKQVRAAMPGVKLYVNDYDITEVGGMDYMHQNGLAAIVQGILDNGGPVDGIGLQSHFNNSLTPPERVWTILDRFAKFGKDLQVTEFDVSPGDEQVQADYTRDYLTACFAHPAIKGFVMWGFWAGRHWEPEAALFTTDWTMKPNGKLWEQLVYHDWWTDVQGTTGADGVFRTRGFLGDYEVEVNGTTTAATAAAGEPRYVGAESVKPGAINAGGVVNAANYAGGGVAPGEIVTIFATGVGAPRIAHAFGDGDRELPAFVGDTRVLFDGKAAPMVYSTANQISAIVPYGVTGSTQVQVEYMGTLTPAVAVPVVAAAPGVFTLDNSGKGQIVAVNVNADGTTALNGAANPAAKGQFITFYITGDGAVAPAARDGVAPSGAYPSPVQTVRTSVGGVDSIAADNWVGLVYAGVTQLNVRIPEGAPSGDAVPVVVTAGGAASQSGATIAIR